MSPPVLLLGIFVPGFVAAAILVVGWKLTSAAARRNPDAPAPIAALAVALGALAGFVALSGWHAWPAEAFHWMPWVAVAAAVLGALEARRAISFASSTILRVVAAAFAVLLVLRKAIFPAGGLDEQLLVQSLAIPLLAIGVWKAIFPALGARTTAATLWMVTVGTAALLLFAGGSRYALAAGALAGALGALFVACFLRRSAPGVQGAVLPVAVILSALVAQSLQYSSADFSPCIFALVAAAPVLGLFPRPAWAKLACIAIPIAIAIAIALRTYDTSAL